MNKTTLKEYIKNLFWLFAMEVNVENIWDLYLFFVEMCKLDKNFKKKFYLLYRKLSIQKSTLNIKFHKIMLNKIKKILMDYKKICQYKPIRKLLYLSLDELHQQNNFLYLPYDIKVKVSFSRKK